MPTHPKAIEIKKEVKNHLKIGNPETLKIVTLKRKITLVFISYKLRETLRIHIKINLFQPVQISLRSKIELIY